MGYRWNIRSRSGFKTPTGMFEDFNNLQNVSKGPVVADEWLVVTLSISPSAFY